jgi:hypothetical protein
MAYAVGLIATDGCLSSDRKTVTQTSADIDLLETYKSCLGSEAPIGRSTAAFRVQICDVGFYDWLVSLGLTQRKSLTLRAVSVPDAVFLDFTRGLLDGDGSVKTPTVVPNPMRYPGRLYQQLRVQFNSASEQHLVWLRERLNLHLEIGGWLGTHPRAGKHTMYSLRYAKHESMALLRALYRDPAAPRLERKWTIWNEFITNGRPTRIWTDRRSDGTGRHSGLKHPWAKAREGSNPSSGTDLGG